MTDVNAYIHFFFIVIAFTEVACWTYDLDEVRKFFDKQQRKEEYWKKHVESQNKEQVLRHEDSTHGRGFGDHYNHGSRENGDSYISHGSHENGESYHNYGRLEDGESYRSHGIQENGGYYPHHERHEQMNSYKKHENLMQTDSHYNNGSPKHTEYFNHGLHHENSYYNRLKPYKGETREYAKDYGYQSYMGLKLHGIMRNGTRYLEGLRLAVENFKRMVENCTSATTTPFPGLRYNGSAPGMELFNSSSVMGLDSNMQWPQIFNMTATMLVHNTSNPLQRARDVIPGAQSTDTGRCANATKEREQVRRLADLAMYTVRQLQDLAMKKGHKGHKNEEVELLVRLAWFLERIAHITGFYPEADSFTPTAGLRQVTTAVTQNPLAFNISDTVKQQMMDCLRKNSTVPATLRCNIPVDMPPIIRMTFNIPENNNEGSPVLSNPVSEPAGGSSTNPTVATMMENPTPIRNNPISNLPQFPGTPSEFTPGSIGELPVENQRTNLPPPSGTPPFSVIGLPNANPSGPPPLEIIQTDASNQMSNLAQFPRAVRSIRKRSTNDPMEKVIKYYVKHKLWTSSNTEITGTIKGELNVDNDMSTPKSVQKRSLDDIIYRSYDENVKSKFFDRSAKALKSETKRSVKYQDWVISRQSEDPQQDISYYIKNKPGTNIRASLLGVAEARLALERIFQTGNIEVVRRYGANYNPLIPSPFYFGVVKTIADI